MKFKLGLIQIEKEQQEDKAIADKVGLTAAIEEAEAAQKALAAAQKRHLTAVADLNRTRKLYDKAQEERKKSAMAAKEQQEYEKSKKEAEEFAERFPETVMSQESSDSLSSSTGLSRSASVEEAGKQPNDKESPSSSSSSSSSSSYSSLNPRRNLTRTMGLSSASILGDQDEDDETEITVPKTKPSGETKRNKGGRGKKRRTYRRKH